MSKHFTPQQFAELLGVTHEHVLSLIRRGLLDAIDVSINRRRPTYRIPAEAVEKFQAGRVVTQPVTPVRRRKLRVTKDYFAKEE